MSTLDASIINYVRKISLEELKDYKFETIAITVNTKLNNGYYDGVGNCCFFISVCDGLSSLGINSFEHEGLKYDVNPINLMIACRYEDWGNMLDTDNEKHAICIKNLAEALEIVIEVYVGEYVSSGVRKLDPEEETPSFGKGNSKVIRIDNSGAHFEFITSSPKDFIYEPKTMTPQKAFELQEEAFESIKGR